jgi:anti-sigma B factor antagonist
LESAYTDNEASSICTFDHRASFVWQRGGVAPWREGSAMAAHQRDHDVGGAFRANGPATFTLHCTSGCAVVVTTGEIDLYTAPALRESLIRAGESSNRIVIDLTAVTFLDSTGLGVMLGAQRRARSTDRSVVLVGPTDMVKRVLHVTGLDRVFPTYARLDEALATGPETELQAL